MVGRSNRRETMVSRRKFIAVSGAAATALATAGCVGSASAQSDVSMGELTVDGDDVTLNSAPSAVNVSVSGEWNVTANQTPEQVKLTLQCHVGEDDPRVDDIATNTQFDKQAGTYEITGDLLEHRDVSADEFNVAAGETVTIPLLVRVICSVVINGEMVSESFVEDTAPITVSAEAIETTVGGSGSVVVVA